MGYGKIAKSGAALALSMLVALFISAAAAPKAQAPCGAVSYLVGSATITHNGKASKMDIDTPVYNNDMIKTKEKSSVEILLDKSTGFSGKVVVASKTTFYLKLNDLKGQPLTTLDLMAGQVGMKVSKIVGNPRAQVRTDGAICGVRGTEFEFMAAPAGDFLVTCAEGQVGLMDADGNEALVDPGKAVQKVGVEIFSELPVDRPLEELRDAWYSERIDALRANPLKALTQFSKYYAVKKPAFDKAAEALSKNAVFARWKKEDESPAFKIDTRSSRTLKDLKEMDGPIMSMQKELFLLERYLYRLNEIRDIIKDGPYWTAELGKNSKGQSVTAEIFFRSFDADYPALEERVAMFRYAERLHQLRSPSGAIGRPGAIDGSMGSFFGDDEGQGDFFK